MKREIRLSISKSEQIQLLEALSEANLVPLAVKVNTAWLDEPGIKAAKSQKDAQFAEGLQTIRGLLFRLKGYLKGIGPRIANPWVAEAIKVLTSLQQNMGE